MTKHILISISRQTLQLFDRGVLVRQYLVSTALNGPGEALGSYKTPRGRHLIQKKIGYDQPLNSVFKSRVPTGEIYSAALGKKFPGRDWVLTRILWLAGMEAGKNKGKGIDSFERYIYIHGTPDSEPMGVARSKGCIRMRNRDVLELFNLVHEGTQVYIIE